jgi:hypothetical protein
VPSKSKAIPYHSASNGPLEGWHRSLNAAKFVIVQYPGSNYYQMFYSASELVSRKTSRPHQQNRSTLCLSGYLETFTNSSVLADSQILVENFCERMRGLRPTTTAHHIKPSMLILKDRYTFSHVLLRTDAVKSPLQTTYSTLYQVNKRLIDFHQN